MYKATKKLAKYFTELGLQASFEKGKNEERDVILLKHKTLLAKIHIWYDKEKVKFELGKNKARGTRSMKALERRLRLAGML